MHSAKIVASIVFLLVVIFIAGSYSLRVMVSTAERLDQQISSIEKNTRDKRWEEASRELQVFLRDWESIEPGWALLIDHSEVDNIDSTLARMEKYIESRDMSSALAEIATLRHYIRHIPEKETVALKNIL